MRSSDSARRNLFSAVLWLCAASLLPPSLLAQCQTPYYYVPAGTYSSGTTSYTNPNTLAASSIVVNGSASYSLVAGKCVILGIPFRATAGTAPTTLHGWVTAFPTAVSASPVGGVGMTQQFTFRFSDAAGYGNLNQLLVLFNTVLNAQNGCFIRYSRADNLLYLAPDGSWDWQGGFAPGSPSSWSNSACTIYGTGSSFTPAGTDLSVTVAVAFKSAFAGTKNIYLFAYDNDLLTSEWLTAGTWTVADSPISITGVSPISGSAGTPVTITGTGFGASGSVSFAGTPAQQIDSWSPTTVVARVPAGATTGVISLSTGIYQTSYQAQQFQVTGGVTVSPSSATLGQMQTQQFTATVTGTTNQQVNWSVTPTGAWSISSTGLFTAPTAVAALQSVTVTATSVALQTAVGSASVSLVPPTPTITTLSLPTGPPQVGLVINGANFGSTNGSVKVAGLAGGDRQLTLIDWKPDKIIVQVPAGTPQGAGQIQVTTSASATSNQVPFTVSATFGCNF